MSTLTVSTNPLADPEDFAAVRGVDYDPTDVTATIALEGASAMVRDYCNQLFDFTADDEVILDGGGQHSLLLPELPVEAVTEVAQLHWDDVETIIDPTEYRLNGSAGVLYRQTVFALGYQNWHITYDHGYLLPRAEGDAPPMPPGIVTAVLQLAQLIHPLIQQGQAVESITIGQFSASTGTANQVTTTGFGSGTFDARVLDRFRRKIAG